MGRRPPLPPPPGYAHGHDVDFFNADVRGRGSEISAMRREGVKNGQKFADVLHGWPLSCITWSKTF